VTTGSTDLVRELEWLLTLTASPGGANKAHKAKPAGERLTAALIASRTHFESRVAALLLSQPHLQRVLPASGHRGLMELVARLEQPLLGMLQRKGRPLLLNRVRVGGAAAPVRLLAVPIHGPVAGQQGALMFVRGTDDAPFNRVHLALAKHVGRHISSLLDAQFDA
jgi:hypothetical protein